MQNGLNDLPEVSYTKEQVITATDSLSVSPTIRGEALTLEQFAWLSSYLSDVSQ